MSYTPAVTTYREGGIYWAEADAVLDVSLECAWKSLERLLMRIIEMPDSGDNSVRLRRAEKNVPLIHVGNELVARAAMLGGVIKASMSMKVTECISGEYLRLDVRTYNMSFAIIDFRIRPVDTGTRMTFRQGFRSRSKRADAKSDGTAAPSREMPETERIFDLWVECAHAMAHANSGTDARSHEPPASSQTG